MNKRQIFLGILFVFLVGFGALLWKGYADLRDFQGEVGQVHVELGSFAESDVKTSEQKEAFKVCSEDRAVAKELPGAKIPEYCRCLAVNVADVVYPMVPSGSQHLTTLVQLGKKYNQALAMTVVIREQCRHRVLPDEQDVSPAGVRGPLVVPGAPALPAAPGAAH